VELGALLGLMPPPMGGKPLGKSMAAFAVQVDEKIRATLDGCERTENRDALDHKWGRVIDEPRVDNAPPLFRSHRSGLLSLTT
jgi:hypothetical protein